MKMRETGKREVEKKNRYIIKKQTDRQNAHM